MDSISVSFIDDNPFNSRLKYEETDIALLADSIQKSGLLSPIRVRKKQERYQLVYGHRRLRAAKMLQWSTIPAEISEISDEQLLELSLTENIARNDLSDFEKGKCFAKLNKDFGKTFEEIGQIYGYSRQHIWNLVRMTDLFNEDTLSKTPGLVDDLHKVSEHHARLLTTIKDPISRANTLKLVISENMSVRELQHLLQGLKGWFREDYQPSAKFIPAKPSRSPLTERYSDLEEIKEALISEFELPSKKDFQSFANFHAFGSGFSIYSAFPPYKMFESQDAIDREKKWFFNLAPYQKSRLRDVQIQFIGKVALATLYVDYEMKQEAHKREVMKVRGTVVFARKRQRWKIIHEHWSEMKPGSLSLYSREYNIGMNISDLV